VGKQSCVALGITEGLANLCVVVRDEVFGILVGVGGGGGRCSGLLLPLRSGGGACQGLGLRRGGGRAGGGGLQGLSHDVTGLLWLIGG